MTTARPDPPGPGHPAADGLLLDWATIWASEAAALACDRELQEAWHRAALLLEASLREVRVPGPDAPAGAAPAGAAPAAGGPADELVQLRRRVGDLERRLAELGG